MLNIQNGTSTTNVGVAIKHHAHETINWTRKRDHQTYVCMYKKLWFLRSVIICRTRVDVGLIDILNFIVPRLNGWDQITSFINEIWESPTGNIYFRISESSSVVAWVWGSFISSNISSSTLSQLVTPTQFILIASRGESRVITTSNIVTLLIVSTNYSFSFGFVEVFYFSTGWAVVIKILNEITFFILL